MVLPLFRLKKVETIDVFGVQSHSNPLSYIVRDAEVAFSEAIANPMYEAVILFGTSKQGKSSLLRNALPHSNCTFVSASAGNTREGIYTELLNQIGAGDGKSIEVATENRSSIGLNMSPAPKFVDLKIDRRKRKKTSEGQREIAIDYTHAGAVARRYFEYAGRIPIVLDNFHFLSLEAQRELATDIRAFGEKGIKIIVLGTWRAQNHLQLLNSDLSGRVKTISIEPWSDADLSKVIDKGEKLLNISFSPNIKSAIIQKSAGIIGLLQRATNEYLVELGIKNKSRLNIHVTDLPRLTMVFDRIAEELLDETKKRFKTITSFGKPFMGRRTRMYWVLLAFLGEQGSLNVDGVEFKKLLAKSNEKLQADRIFEKIIDPKYLRNMLGDMLLEEQQKKFTTPLIDYDPLSERLIVIDGWTLFTLRRRREEILNAIS